MTTRELREALFYVTDQKMTVEELRHMLFNERDQDAELDLRFGVFAKLEKIRNDQIEREKNL